MSNTLAILIAKSGVALLDLLPREWEVVIADHSRLDQRNVEFWNRPSKERYDEVVIVDQNVTTALTQRKIELKLREMGITGNFKYAGNARTRLGYRHMDYVLGKEGLLLKTAADIQSDPYKLNKHMVALVGLPASGKTLLRNLFSRLPGFSVYKWGKFLRSTVEGLYGPMTYENGWQMAMRFTDEVESQDRIAVAKSFVAAEAVRQDPAQYMVVDGIKSREQIIYTSYALRRPAIIVKVQRDEQERQSEARKRGDFDDVNDSERLEVLRKMGAIDVMDFADFVVETTGCATEYDKEKRDCRIRFTEQFIAGMQEVLSWLYISDSFEAAREMLCKSAVEVAKERGFNAETEVVI